MTEEEKTIETNNNKELTEKDNSKTQAPQIINKTEKSKPQSLERIYTIPLKRAYLKAPRHERARIAIREIKRFLVRHMKIRDRDLDKIKLDTYFNNFVWKRGKYNPPSKIKVLATKKDDFVIVNFVDVPESIKFSKARHEKRHKTSEEKSKPIQTIKEQDKESEKTEAKEIDEKEKQQSTAQAKEKIAEAQAKTEKHMAKVSKDKSSTKQRQVLSRH